MTGERKTEGREGKENTDDTTERIADFDGNILIRTISSYAFVHLFT